MYILWLLLVYNSPAVHPCIKEEEREYIESVIPSAMAKKLVTDSLFGFIYSKLRHQTNVFHGYLEKINPKQEIIPTLLLQLVEPDSCRVGIEGEP